MNIGYSKRIYYLIRVFLLIIIMSGPFFPVYSQIVVATKVNENSDGVSLEIISTAESFVRKTENQNLFDYSYYSDESIPGKPILPSQTFIIAIPPYSEVDANLIEKTEKLFNNVVVNINPQIIAETDSSFGYKPVEISPKYLSNDLIPLSEVEILKYFWIRDFYCVAIKVNPVQFSWKNKSLKSISAAKLEIHFKNLKPYQKQSDPISNFEKDLKDVILNFSTAQNFRTKRIISQNQDSLGNWIDYSKTYYKLAIIKDGIHRITYNNLLAYDIVPSTINPKTIKIFRNGEQLPLFVSGEDDFVFNQNDYIEFWGEKNYSSSNYQEIVEIGQDYINYLDRYSDTSMVWLTFGGDEGERMQIQSSSSVTTADTIKSYLNKQHFERDLRLWYHSTDEPRTQLPFWQEHKVFTWLLSSNSSSQSITFFAPDFVPGTPVKTLSRLISNQYALTTTYHRHGASLNSTVPTDTITFNIKQTANFNSVFSSNELTDTSNIYRIFGLPSNGSHRSLVDWVDIEYYRQNKALNDSITILIPDSLSEDLRNVIISNINTPDSLIKIYKIGNESKKIISFNYLNGNLIFADSIRGGDRYVILKQSYFITPVFRYSRGFANLRDVTRDADYIIITHKSLRQSTDEYKLFIEDNYNLRVERIFVEDIYDEFSYGQNRAESIKEFLIYAKDYWISPAPSYLVLIGDANYDYKNKWNPAPSPRKKNLVPSYGFPVSDQWFGTWDSNNINIPQIYIGRIPANSDNEVRTYLTKYQNYVARRLDDWNKRYTLFSGGDPTKPSELASIKLSNDQLSNNVIKPDPVGGNAIHFYKTLDPSTNFGPFTNEYVNNTIDSSGLFINYIGHSGTRTWDNGITEVEDIRSIFPDRYPLISDFGCSTGKFAEPDVDAFGELFICQSSKGEAIGYLGNSSLGFLSTSLSFPNIFYRNLLVDSNLSISKSHVLSKISLMNTSGYNEVSRVFNYCNILFEDPLLELALPTKSNFVVNRSSVSLPNQISDLEDSIKVTINIFNWGKVIQDSITLIVSNSFQDTLTFIDTLKIKSPTIQENVKAYIRSEGLVGTHKLLIRIDPKNLVDELYEDDNDQEFIYSIYATNIRSIVSDDFYSLRKDTLKFLNPIYEESQSVNDFTVSLSNDITNSNNTEFKVMFDTVFSKLSLNNISDDPRLWYRARLNTPEIKWSANYSFRNAEANYDWFIDKSYNPKDVSLEYSVFDSVDYSWKLAEIVNNLKLTSAGSNDGKFASVLFNNQERLPNTFFWGIASAEIDTITYEPYNIRYYSYPNSISQNSDSLTSYINSLPQGKIIALVICDDAAQIVLGFNSGTAVRRAIETLGSYYIDSVRYRESWCMLGIKGASVGSVPESYKKLFKGFATVEAEKEFFPDSGMVAFPIIKQSSRWESVTVSNSIPIGASLELMPIGIRNNGIMDTLNSLNLDNGHSALNAIDASVYPNLKFLLKLKPNDLNESPKIQSLGVNYIATPELGTNFQVVGVDNDTIPAGGSVNLSFWVYNVGEADADSFNVKVDVVNQNNTSSNIFSETVSTLAADSRKRFDINYQPAADNDSEKRFVINIDSDNKVNEYFEDNNFFTKSFYIQSDEIPPAVKITFDELEVIDGDFVSNNPTIKIALSDESPVPIIDTSAVKIYLNEDPIYYGANPLTLNYTINSGNPKFVAEYKPNLADGDYLLRVVAKDPSGNIADSASSEVYFVVSSDTKLMEVYNYPNPFSNDTYFTFRLSQIPEEVKIRIYTIAGRMIKEIARKSSELNFDLNRIYWDGRDEDGDVIANGTYLYKMIMKDADKVESVTQKLSKVK